MKIAVSANENTGLDSAIGTHFGRCPYFVLIDVDGSGQVEAVQTIVNPYYNHHEPGQVPGFIHSQAADTSALGRGAEADDRLSHLVVVN